MATLETDFGSNAEMERLLNQLGAWIQDEVKACGDGETDSLEEIAIDIGKPVVVRRNRQYFTREDAVKLQIVKEADLTYIMNRLGEFRDDNRIGIEGTLHRVSVMRDENKSPTGLTIRFARAIYGVAECLRPLLLSSQGILVIGAPGTGKTTLLRDIVRILAEKLQSGLVVVDTSNEIGGAGMIAHPMLGLARRMKVPSKAVQYAIILEAVGNHGPDTLVIDEIKNTLEVDSLLDVSQRGVNLVATVHGRNIHQPIRNRVINPLLGQPNLITGELESEPIFETAVVVVEKGLYHVYTDLVNTIPCLIRGEFVPPVIFDIRSPAPTATRGHVLAV
jgi:stage III sporulation protein SpoIIIAA